MSGLSVGLSFRLGMLVQPASGYDLKQEFEQQQAHYWSANLAQIYPTLKRMKAEGLVASEEQPSDKGPPRKVYRRTEAGRAALVEWLQTGPEVHSDRLSWLTQVGFLSALDRAGQLDFLHALKDEFQRHRLNRVLRRSMVPTNQNRARFCPLRAATGVKRHLAASLDTAEILGKGRLHFLFTYAKAR